ncbi:hypothetical protein [Wolbachia endosymbiont (group A) of Barypeithes pellucidus]|uniref:hypothetical protein n=1 Tax=Wolbachia endosymbiont (group A) of Barypeithes pellucidus TaxID=3139322 RepID=UPI003CCAE543
MKTNIDEPCAGNLQARFFRGSCSNITQTRGVKLQLLPNITGCSFDYKTNEEALNDGNQYKTKGEILDENFNVVGNLDMQGSLYYFHYYDHSIAITYDIEINLEGNIEKILSLNMMSKKDFIDSYHPSNSEQEIFNLGNGHIKITEDSFDQNTGYYKVLSEILDENSNVIGNLNIHGPLWNFYHDDYKINIHYGMEVNLKGDIKKILSL